MRRIQAARSAAIISSGSLVIIIVYVTVGKLGLLPLPILPVIGFAIIGSATGLTLGLRARAAGETPQGGQERFAAGLAIVLGAVILAGALLALALFIFVVFGNPR